MDYDAKAKMVVDWAVWPAFSSVEGKLGWLGEFGKCWVSKVKFVGSFPPQGAGRGSGGSAGGFAVKGGPRGNL